jgi:transcriptional regulator with XRE-family HTH domain
VARKDTDPLDSHVASRLRTRRLMLGMTQERLAEALGLTVHQVQNYEAGTNRISASRLHQLAHILKVPGAGFFFEGAPSPRGFESRTNVTDFLMTFPTALEDYEMVRAYLRIKDSKLRRCVVVLVQAVADSERTGH